MTERSEQRANRDRNSVIDKILALQPGDRCEFRFPARKHWQGGVVEFNGRTGYWRIRADDSGKVVHGLYIENVRLPGTDPWFR